MYCIYITYIYAYIHINTHIIIVCNMPAYHILYTYKQNYIYESAS